MALTEMDFANGGGSESNSLKELCRSKVQSGTPTVPTIVSNRATNVYGGYIEEFIANAAGLSKDNYLAYWDIIFKYALATTAGQVYGAVFQNLPVPASWGRGFPSGAVLYSDDGDMLIIYESDGVFYAQVTPMHDYSVGHIFEFYGIHGLSKDR